MPGGIQPPIQELLRWPAPNHINPTTRSDYVIITACILTPISVTLLCTRLYVRISMQRNAGVDDWFMLAALVSAILTAAETLLSLIVSNDCYERSLPIWYVLREV